MRETAQSLFLECFLVVVCFVVATVAAWLTKRLDSARDKRRELESDLRSAKAQDESRVRFIEGLQQKNAELTTRLDEARRATKGGES